MGVDFQDYDNDGWEDIHLTALTGETFPLFRNESVHTRASFVETTGTSGLAPLTVKASGWCSVFADIDNDGWKDIFTANSHVNDRIGDFEAIDFKQAEQPVPQRWPRPVSRRDGGLRPRGRGCNAHRGCGVADFNGDGRLDVVVLVLGAPAELWQNDSAPDRHWLIVRLVGSRSNRDGLGARVTVGNQVRTMTTASATRRHHTRGFTLDWALPRRFRAHRGAVAVGDSANRRES